MSLATNLWKPTPVPLQHAPYSPGPKHNQTPLSLSLHAGFRGHSKHLVPVSHTTSQDDRESEAGGISTCAAEAGRYAVHCCRRALSHTLLYEAFATTMCGRQTRCRRSSSAVTVTAEFETTVHRQYCMMSWNERTSCRTYVFCMRAPAPHTPRCRIYTYFTLLIAG